MDVQINPRPCTSGTAFEKPPEKDLNLVRFVILIELSGIDLQLVKYYIAGFPMQCLKLTFTQLYTGGGYIRPQRPIFWL